MIAEQLTHEINEHVAQVEEKRHRLDDAWSTRRIVEQHRFKGDVLRACEKCSNRAHYFAEINVGFFERWFFVLCEECLKEKQVIDFFLDKPSDTQVFLSANQALGMSPKYVLSPNYVPR